MTTTHEDRWTIKLDRPMDVRPVGDKVLVRPLSPEERTRGGLIIPDSATRHPLAGHVLAVGAGRVSAQGVLLPVNVKPGDLVFYNRHAGTAVKTGDEDVVLLMCLDDVLAVAEERKPGPCPMCQGKGA